MKLAFVNIMHELYQLDSTATISQPPVPLAVLNAVTPKAIETALVDEQTDEVQFDGDAFAFSLATQFAGKVYRYADDLRAAGKEGHSGWHSCHRLSRGGDAPRGRHCDR